MNSEERQLISGLFDRMRDTTVGEKDQHAEALINQSVRQIPDSAYILVQSVLVQEHAMEQQAARIGELEARVRELERGPAAAAQPAASGGFLGGLFGGARPAASAPSGRSAVPGAGRAMGAPATAGGSPWANAPGYGAAQQPAQAQAPAGGGFMRSAMTTAAGVAGGMLAANAISSMLNGGSAAQAATPADTAATDAAAEPSAFDADAYDNQGLQEASAEDGSWGDFGGEDLDI